MIALLEAVPLRWWFYFAAAAAIGILLWHDHHATHRANQLAVEKAQAITNQRQAEANLAAYKAAREADDKLNTETVHDLQTRLAAADAAAAHPPRVLCRAARVPGAAPEGGAAAGADGSPVNGGDAGALQDVGPEVAGARRELETCVAVAIGLQEWERARR